MEQEIVSRELITILAADVEGYSRLMEANEDATLETLRAFRQVMDDLISKHGGRIANTAGDSVVAAFKSAIGAVQCAIEIQSQLAPKNAGLPRNSQVWFRIGINIGDVIRNGEDVLGDGVNVAARLEGIAEPGGICISRIVYDQVSEKVHLNYEYLGDQAVKNIERPVSAYRINVEKQPSSEPEVVNRQRWKYGIASSLVVLVLVGGFSIWLKNGENVETPQSDGMTVTPTEKPSIAVLAFNNMSGDPEQEYFSDGITEDLITDLSQISGLFVIARNSSFAYKGQAVNVPRVAKELGVRYVLEGSVRKAGGRIRINAQLIDSTTGGHVWAERFDRNVADVFNLQDEVTKKIVSALSVTLKPREEKQLTTTEAIDPEAYDRFLQGLQRLRVFTPETSQEAREHFYHSIKIDPRYARAYSVLGFSHAMDVFLGTVFDLEVDAALQRAERNIAVALKLDGTNPQVLFSASFVHARLRRFDDAVSFALRATELDPNYADGFGQLASAYVSAGMAKEALVAIEKAIRLNPELPFFYLDVWARANFVLKRYTEAAEAYEKVVRRNPAFISGQRGLAASYAYLGRIEDAEWQADELLILEPEFSLKKVSQTALFKQPEDIEHFVEGLRLAGLPE